MKHFTYPRKVMTETTVVWETGPPEVNVKTWRRQQINRYLEYNADSKPKDVPTVWFTKRTKASNFHTHIFLEFRVPTQIV